MILCWLSHTFFLFDLLGRLLLKARAEILTKISLFFWSIWRHQKDISKLTDLYHCYCLLRYFLKKFLRQTKPPFFLAFFSGFGMCINCTTLVSKCMLRHNSISHFKKDEINPTANIIEENCLPSAKYKSYFLAL